MILCGGAGARLVRADGDAPKPLVEIGGRPILWHIMKHYSRYGFNEFVLALGYKGEQIKRYFLDYRAVEPRHDRSRFGTARRAAHATREAWRVHLVDTGEGTLTAAAGCKQLQR